MTQTGPVPQSDRPPTSGRRGVGLRTEFLAQPAQENHIVQFYDDEEFLCSVVAHFIAGGLDAGEPIVVIATSAHREAFVARLEQQGFDTGAAIVAGRFVLLDARETLATFMVDGLPDWDRFHDAMRATFAAVAGPDERLRAYGEMVDLLWRDGSGEAAVRLEQLWNDIGLLHSFSLLCAYDMANFARAADGKGFAEVCGCHSHVIPAEGYARIESEEERLRVVTSLQQRARALEDEIERRKQTEHELREALRVRDDFLAIAGHELRTPLTAAQLYAESVVTLSQRGASIARIQERAEKASQTLGRLGVLVEALLHAPRLRAGRITLEIDDVDLTAVTLEVVADAAEALADARCELRFIESSPLHGRWDHNRIGEVISNLVNNAMKYGKGSPITVWVEETAAGTARVIVRDRGIGIAAEDHARIFERFERAVANTSISGLGLGLWVSRQIVEAHGGTLRVESAAGAGATFTVELPR